VQPSGPLKGPVQRILPRGQVPGCPGLDLPPPPPGLAQAREAALRSAGKRLAGERSRASPTRRRYGTRPPPTQRSFDPPLGQISGCTAGPIIREFLHENEPHPYWSFRPHLPDFCMKKAIPRKGGRVRRRPTRLPDRARGAPVPGDFGGPAASLHLLGPPAVLGGEVGPKSLERISPDR